MISKDIPFEMKCKDGGSLSKLNYYGIVRNDDAVATTLQDEPYWYGYCNDPKKLRPANNCTSLINTGNILN